MAASGWPPFRLLISALSISALGTFTVGYHMGVVNIPQVILERFVNESIYSHYHRPLDKSQLSIVWAVVANTHGLGGMAGAWSTMFLAERYGRKFSLLVINSILIIVGSILMGISKITNSMELLAIGRLSNGFCCGLATGLLGLYLTECSPIKYRGLSGTFINLFITATTLLSEIVSLPQLLGTDNLWPVLLALSAFPAIIQLGMSWLVPESPKYLLLTSNDERKAKESILFFHGTRANVEELFEEFRKENDLTKGQLSLKEAWSDFDLFWPIFLSVVINVTRMATGIGAVFTYSTDIFKSVGLAESQAPLASIITSAFNLAGAFIALPLIERCGRRPLMLIGLLICLVCDIVFMAFSLWQQYNNTRDWPAYVSLLAIIVHVTAFNIGPGAVGWFISSESTPQSVRSIGASVSMTANWVSALICGLVYLPLQERTGAWSFLLFIVPTAVGTWFLWLKMPETKNRTVEEIMKTWQTKKEISSEDEDKVGELEKF